MTISTTHPSDAPPARRALPSATNWAARIGLFWRTFSATAFATYHPELHYMRGPGPAWRAKHGTPPQP